MLWKPLRDLISYYYLNAPLRLGGWEGSEHMDICASLTSLPSSHWIGDIRRLECEQRINRAVDSWTTALLFAILTLVVTSTLWNFPSLLYRTWVFLTTRKKEEVLAVPLNRNDPRDLLRKELKTWKDKRTKRENKWYSASHIILDVFRGRAYQMILRNPKTLGTTLFEMLDDDLRRDSYQKLRQELELAQEKILQLERQLAPEDAPVMNLRNRAVNRNENQLLNRLEDAELDHEVD